MLMNYPGQSLGICTHIITGIYSRLLSQALKNLSKEPLVVNESWNKKATKARLWVPKLREMLPSFVHLCFGAVLDIGLGCNKHVTLNCAWRACVYSVIFF